MEFILAVGGVSFTLGAIFFYHIGKWRGRSVEKAVLRSEIEREQSRDAHNEATEREPPVSIGDSVTLGVQEFRTHHSGTEQAVCKKEGFVIFVEECPQGIEVGDTITAKITSFGKNENSAQAVYQS